MLVIETIESYPNKKIYVDDIGIAGNVLYKSLFFIRNNSISVP